eukprot:CAMPEP_0196751700 /NCGR_PEP_ID=MMETSP1091-20130531/84644_1 /TAXON_ID=302021 /ORGANISM="Rhodomonas sp., Strain CCMP768" /LENGTH=61 /DNA_ID=CAMNT_0042099529 /DNA_START=12 /DNA_END=193 /DNA_ORIENTATION=-
MAGATSNTMADDYRIIKRIVHDPSASLSTTQLNELWDPTFTWWERWVLFWSAPAVLFLANS